MANVQNVKLHTAEQVKGYVDEALRIVTELEVTDQLLVPAFTETVRLLAASVQLVDQAPPLGIVPDPFGGRGLRGVG